MDFYTTKQAANVLNVSPETLRKWEADGKLGFEISKTAGGHRRYPAPGIQELKDKLADGVALVSSDIVDVKPRGEAREPSALDGLSNFCFFIGVIALIAAAILIISSLPHMVSAAMPAFEAGGKPDPMPDGLKMGLACLGLSVLGLFAGVGMRSGKAGRGRGQGQPAGKGNA